MNPWLPNLKPVYLRRTCQPMKNIAKSPEESLHLDEENYRGDLRINFWKILVRKRNP